MFHIDAYFAQQCNVIAAKNQADTIAQQLYLAASLRGKVRKVWGAVSGKPHRLLDLNKVEAESNVPGRSYGGVKTVELAQIRGTEGRGDDFDADFNPLKPHSRERWTRIARVFLRDGGLPPVELIQVGEIYFVRDGHHRVSVARASGQQSIEAEVTVWKVSNEQACQQPGLQCNLAPLPA